MADSIRFLTVSQVAEIIQLTEGRIYEAIRRNLLPAVRIGRQVRVDEAVFLEWARTGGTAYSDGRHLN